MHSKSDIIELMIYDNADEVIEEPFKPLLNRYQIGLETLMRGSDFIFDCIYLLYSKYHKMNPNPGGSYIDSPNWTKNKKATTNLINDDDKCFQYAAPVTLNHEETGKKVAKIIKN